MMRRIFRTILVVYAITLGYAASAQKRQPNQAISVDLNEVKALSPASVTTSKALEFSSVLTRKYGFLESKLNYDIHAGEDPNLIYKRARPFPEIGYVGPYPSNFGVRSIMATRLHWPWPPPDLRSIPDEETQTLWRWEVPKLMQKRWWRQAGGIGSDRFSAVCFCAYGKNAIVTDIQLFYFDTLSGLRWQATVPIKQTLESLSIAQEGTPLTCNSDNVNVMLGISADGSRVLVLVSRDDKRSLLLYIFTGTGELLRTLQFTDCDLYYSGMEFWQLSRPSANMFLLSLCHLTMINGLRGGIGDYLIDGDGNMVNRFVNDRGEPVHAWRISETHVLAFELHPDQLYRQYLYELPLQK